MPHERPGHCCLTLPTTHCCHHRCPRDQFRPSDSLSPKRSPGPIPSSLSPPYICLVFTSMFVCKASLVCGISPHAVQFSLSSASISTTPALPPSSAEPACPSASESCHGSCSEVCPSPRDTHQQIQTGQHPERSPEGLGKQTKEITTQETLLFFFSFLVSVVPIPFQSHRLWVGGTMTIHISTGLSP